MPNIHRGSSITMPDNFGDQKLDPETDNPEKNINPWSILLNSKIFMQYHSKIMRIIHFKDHILK